MASNTSDDSALFPLTHLKYCSEDIQEDFLFRKANSGQMKGLSGKGIGHALPQEAFSSTM